MKQLLLFIISLQISLLLVGYLFYSLPLWITTLPITLPVFWIILVNVVVRYLVWRDKVKSKTK